MNVLKWWNDNLLKRGVLMLMAVLMSSCASSPRLDLLSREGAKFNRELSNAVRSADEIRLVEHSCPADFEGLNSAQDKVPSYIYRRKSLSLTDREYFAQQVEQLSDVKRRAQPLCEFDPHYTLHFYQKGELASSMKISFLCREIKWKNGSKYRASRDLFKALNALVKRVGMTPNADWGKKALDRYQVELEKQQEKQSDRRSEKSEYPIAKPVPGKPGFVFNPFTQNHVNVEGIPSGVKVIDPHDQEKRIFRVP